MTPIYFQDSNLCIRIFTIHKVAYQWNSPVSRRRCILVGLLYGPFKLYWPQLIAINLEYYISFYTLPQKNSVSLLPFISHFFFFLLFEGNTFFFYLLHFSLFYFYLFYFSSIISWSIVSFLLKTLLMLRPMFSLCNCYW